jgi:hypothetical protein
MALQNSGEIKLSDINVELDYPATNYISLDSAAVRDLLDTPSGPMDLSSFYGVSYFSIAETGVANRLIFNQQTIGITGQEYFTDSAITIAGLSIFTNTSGSNNIKPFVYIGTSPDTRSYPTAPNWKHSGENWAPQVDYTANTYSPMIVIDDIAIPAGYYFIVGADEGPYWQTKGDTLGAGLQLIESESGLYVMDSFFAADTQFGDDLYNLPTELGGTGSSSVMFPNENTSYKLYFNV